MANNSESAETASGIRPVRVEVDENKIRARLEKAGDDIADNAADNIAADIADGAATEDALLVFARPAPPQNPNYIEPAVTVDDENSFRQDRVSREDRKIIREMRKQEEEKPILFFEKDTLELSGQTEDSEAGLKKKKPAPVEPETESVNAVHEFFDWVKHIAVAVLIGLLLVIFVIQRNVVIGSSMEPNLYDNDQLFVQKVSRFFSNGIGCGDIVTINADGLEGHSGTKDIIKRVIGTPGDTVDINDDGVYRNGVKLSEPYLESDVITDDRNENFSHVTLGPNQYYVLGDNREVSLDSRVFGPIDKSRIIGEVLIRFYPLDKIGMP